MAFDKIRQALRNVVVRGALKHAPDSTIAKVIGDLYPYKDTVTYRRVPAAPLDRAAVLAEIAGMAHGEDARGDKGTVSGSLYCGDHDHDHFLGEVFDQFSTPTC